MIESEELISPDDQVLNSWALGSVANVASIDKMHIMIANPTPFEKVLPEGLIWCGWVRWVCMPPKGWKESHMALYIGLVLVFWAKM